MDVNMREKNSLECRYGKREYETFNNNINATRFESNYKQHKKFMRIQVVEMMKRDWTKKEKAYAYCSGDVPYYLLCSPEALTHLIKTCFGTGKYCILGYTNRRRNKKFNSNFKCLKHNCPVKKIGKCKKRPGVKSKVCRMNATVTKGFKTLCIIEVFKVCKVDSDGLENWCYKSKILRNYKFIHRFHFWRNKFYIQEFENETTFII